MTVLARSRAAASALAVLVALLHPGIACGQGPRQTPGTANGNRAMNNQVRNLMQAVVKASHGLKLHGVREVQQNVAGRLVPHTEEVWMDGIRIRVQFPNPPLRGQVIVDDGRQRQHLFPRRHVVREEPPHRDNLVERFAFMLSRKREPRASVADGGQIAGVRTVMFTVYNQANQITQELWIDPRTGAVLKRVGLNKLGATVAYYEFTKVEYNAPISDAYFSIDARGAKRVTLLDELVQGAKKAGLSPLALRPSTGFVLSGSRVRMVNGIQVLTSTYQGPRGRLMIMLLRAKVRPEALQDKVTAGQSTLTVQKDGNTVVLIGPYTPGDLQSSANALGSP